MYDKKINKVDELRVNYGIVKVASGLTKKILTSELEGVKKPDLPVWWQLSEAVLARLILFNARRQGEASKILLEANQEVGQGWLAHRVHREFLRLHDDNVVELAKVS